MKKALITGITGQDDSHLTGFLLSKGRVISDESLRAGLVERGQLQVMRFSWDAMARAVYEAYLRIV
jgi:GDP-D-mannose dehydratase